MFASGDLPTVPPRRSLSEAGFFARNHSATAERPSQESSSFTAHRLKTVEFPNESMVFLLKIRFVSRFTAYIQKMCINLSVAASRKCALTKSNRV
jgi:hypothetical protein